MSTHFEPVRALFWLQLGIPRRNARSILRTHRHGSRFNSHSQTVTTNHARRRRSARMRLSRRRLPWIFVDQNSRFVFGVRFRPQPWPCQKQPCTNTTTRRSGQAKSGFPGSGRWRRQPLRRCWRKSATTRISVVALPVLRTRVMSAERLSLPNDVICSYVLERMSHRTARLWDEA